MSLPDSLARGGRYSLGDAIAVRWGAKTVKCPESARMFDGYVSNRVVRGVALESSNQSINSGAVRCRELVVLDEGNSKRESSKSQSEGCGKLHSRPIRMSTCSGDRSFGQAAFTSSSLFPLPTINASLTSYYSRTIMMTGLPCFGQMQQVVIPRDMKRGNIIYMRCPPIPHIER